MLPEQLPGAGDDASSSLHFLRRQMLPTRLHFLRRQMLPEQLTPRRASDVATVDSPTLTATDDDCQDDDVTTDDDVTRRVVVTRHTGICHL